MCMWTFQRWDHLLNIIWVKHVWNSIVVQSLKLYGVFINFEKYINFSKNGVLAANEKNANKLKRKFAQTVTLWQSYRVAFQQLINRHL
jgi:hypothetical protein